MSKFWGSLHFRDVKQREKYRNDFACTDPKAAKDQLLPSYSKGNPEVPPEIYQKTRQAYLELTKNNR